MKQGMLRDKTLFIVFLLPMTLSLVSLAMIPNGVINSKELAGYLIVAILLLLTSIKLLKGEKMTFNKLDIAILFLLVVTPLIQSLFINISETSLLRSYTNASLYYCVRVITTNFTWKTRLLSFYTAAFIISILQILISAGQYWNLLESYHSLRIISGMFFNPGPLAIYLSSFTILIFTLASYFRIILNRQMMWISIVLGFFLTCIILQLYSRTAWLSFVIGLISLYFFNKSLSNRFNTICRLDQYALAVVILLIPLALFFYHLRPSSVEGRELIWNSTLEMIKSHPVFGVGLGRFKSEYMHFQGIFLTKNEANMRQFNSFAGETNYAFNDFLQLISEQGIVAVGVYIYIIVKGYTVFCYKVKNIPRNVRTLYCGIVVSTIVILLSGLTSYPLQMLPICAFFWTAIAVCNSKQGIEDDGMLNENYQRILGYILALLALNFSCVFFVKTHSYLIWKQSVDGYVRNERLLDIHAYLKDDPDYNNHVAHRLYSQKQYKKALPFFRAATLYKFEKDYIYDLGMCLEQLQDFRAAEDQYETIQSSIPHLIRPKFLIAKLYLSEGEIHKFKLKLAEFMASSKNSKSFEIQLMRQQMLSLINTNQIKINSYVKNGLKNNQSATTKK